MQGQKLTVKKYDYENGAKLINNFLKWGRKNKAALVTERPFIYNRCLAKEKTCYGTLI